MEKFSVAEKAIYNAPLSYGDTFTQSLPMALVGMAMVLWLWELHTSAGGSLREPSAVPCLWTCVILCGLSVQLVDFGAGMGFACYDL